MIAYTVQYPYEAPIVYFTTEEKAQEWIKQEQYWLTQRNESEGTNYTFAQELYIEQIEIQ